MDQLRPDQLGTAERVSADFGAVTRSMNAMIDDFSGDAAAAVATLTESHREEPDG